MEIAYWVVAALLGVVYLYSGGQKVVQSQAQLAPMMGWVDTIPMWLVRCIGVVEILGVIVLALVAAIGFAVLQVLAAGLHLSRGEVKEIGLNIVLIALAAVAAWLATIW
jgi:hypothetical protein